MAARNPLAFSVRTARSGEAMPPRPDADLAHARATDPEGVFVAHDADGRPLGTAWAAVREDALLVLGLDVAAAHRAAGVGRALLAAARAYGSARGARSLEVLAPDEPSALAFFLRAGLSLRSLVLDLTAEVSGSSPAGGSSLHAVSPGASFYGWIATLDRETRGFARPREWARWAQEGHVVSWRRGGRPVAVGAWHPGARGTALGPIAARVPEGAADFLPLLASHAGGKRFSLALPAEAPALLAAARSLGFRAVSTRPLLSDHRGGDLRRYGGGGGRFF